MIYLKEFLFDDFKETVKSIYKKESWSAYLSDDEKLKRAFDRSLCNIGAFCGDTLVGFVRCVGDGEHIVLVQDLIVDRDFQKQGIGTKLFKTAWEKYAAVRMFHVVTDISDPIANRFYRTFGMKELRDGHMISYFR